MPSHAGRAPHVVFVCWGNICRSAMAEKVAQKQAEDQGLDVVITSAGVSSEERGNPVYPPAQRVLRAHGYPSAPHRAHRITAAEIEDADLVIAMEDIHVTMMRRLAPDAANLRLLTDFDPAARPGQPVPDPWGGPDSDYEDTLAAIEAALPGIFHAVRALA